MEYKYEYADVGPARGGGRRIVRSGGRWGTMYFVGHYRAGGTMKLFPADAASYKYAGVTVVRCELVQIWRPGEANKATPADAEAEALRARRAARREAARRVEAEQIKMEV